MTLHAELPSRDELWQKHKKAHQIHQKENTNKALVLEGFYNAYEAFRRGRDDDFWRKALKEWADNLKEHIYENHD